MDIEIFTQPELANGETFTLGKRIADLINSGDFSEISFFVGLMKDDAYATLFESIKGFILNGGNVNFYLGYDKRRNNRKTLNSLLELGCNVYLCKENNSPEFQYKTILFENEKNAKALFVSGNFTMSGLYEGINTTIEFSYSFRGKGKAEFAQLKSSLLSKSVTKLFQQIDRKNLDEVIGDGALPSIEEFTRKDLADAPKTEIKTDLSDISIDIEIDDNVDFLTPVAEAPKKVIKEPVKKENAVIEEKVIPEPILDLSSEEPKYYMEDDAIDIESMLFQSQHEEKVETPIVSPVINNPHYHNFVEEEHIIEDPTESETKIIMKNTNLSKTSIFMIQAPKITKKGANAGEIKIPTYLRDLIPYFWGWPKDYKIDRDNAEKYQNCILKIVDTKNPNEVITDDNAKLFQREGENNFNVYSKVLNEMNIEENDILRFIKTQSADGYYFCCEVVHQDAQEYPIWDQFCTTTLKSSKRRYGMM